MAKKQDDKEGVVERTYNIPLRREFLKVPRYKRAKKAVTAIKEFIQRHMKATQVKLGSHLNKLIWLNGIRNPPHHVRVNAVKDSKGLVKVELLALPKEKEKKVKIKERLIPKRGEEQAKEQPKPTPAPAKEEPKGEEGKAETVKAEEKQAKEDSKSSADELAVSEAQPKPSPKKGTKKKV